MLAIVPLLVASSLLNSASAAPSFKLTGCDVSKAKLNLPAGQTALAVPAGQVPKFVAIGVGIQNYTCGSTGTYTSIGALATLFDASCAAGSPYLDYLPEILFEADKVDPNSIKILGQTPLKLGDHLFVTNPITGSGIVPRFDFTSSQHSADAVVDCSKTGDIPAPTNPAQNVDWLQLTQLTGHLAKTVFRVQTFQGQPPTSCTGSGTITVPYAAEYWFFS